MSPVLEAFHTWHCSWVQ